MKETHKGIRVKARITLGGKTENVEFRNVTEIHYRYPTPLQQYSIAFESDIHGTGCTYRLKDVDEFEAKPETTLAKSF